MAAAVEMPERTGPVEHDPAGEQRPSLRERKKLATRVAIRRTAVDLFAERGFSNVTVEDIAEAAEISPRTFFNYFQSKEAVLFGIDPEYTEELRKRLVDQPPEKSAFEALGVVLVEGVRELNSELNELGGDRAAWLARLKAVQTDPQLGVAQAAHMANVERVIAGAIAERLGVPEDSDPYPILLANAAMGVMRAVLTIWSMTGGAVPLERLIESAWRALAQGLPQDCEVRRTVQGLLGGPVTAAGTRKVKGEGR
jgi:AcrR family transcriptional regulator